jgi:hypothetical protein
MPLAPLGPTLDKVTPFATVTAISPSLPRPAVVLAICAPPVTVRLPASSVTEPPDPDLGPVADAAIWVLATPRPSSKSAPGVVTLTDPPAPDPRVFVEIEPPLSISKVPAVTKTLPAFPVLPTSAWELIPLGGLGSPRYRRLTARPLRRP